MMSDHAQLGQLIDTPETNPPWVFLQRGPLSVSTLAVSCCAIKAFSETRTKGEAS